MILVDSSIWIDHLRRESATVSRLLSSDQILMHPFVVGEVAVGHLRNRSQINDFRLLQKYCHCQLRLEGQLISSSGRKRARFAP